MTIANDLMVAVLGRLAGSPPVVDDTTRIRREHRTIVSREQAPSVYLVDGTEAPAPQAWGKCDPVLTMDFIVRIFVRDDQGYGAADAIKANVFAALDPAVGYPHSAQLARGRVSSEQEIADQDVIAVDMAFAFRYVATGWGA